VRAFRDALAGAGVAVTVRPQFGTRIAAACGQLVAGYDRDGGTVRRR
jgi:adenine C2-methylase RlmN of 23S rRNA A2503 and tRNA A37